MSIGGGERRRVAAPVSGLALVAAALLASGAGAQRSDDVPSPSLARRVSQSGRGAFEASLAKLAIDGHERLAVAWQDNRDGNSEIYMRLLDDDGKPSGPERRLTRDDAASLEANTDGLGAYLLVAWYEKSDDGIFSAHLGKWRHDGRPAWRQRLPGQARSAVVKSLGDRIFAAWVAVREGERESVWAGFWDKNGTPVVPPRELGPAGPDTWNLNAAIDARGVAHVVFDSDAESRASEVYLAQLSADSSVLRRLTPDDGFASIYPDLAFGPEPSRVALTWFDERDGNREVYLYAGELPGEAAQVTRGARRVSVTPGESIGAYVAWNGDQIGLAWSDDTAGSFEIYLQRFDPRGRPQAAALRVTQTSSASLIPAIRPWRTGFALAWNELLGGNPLGHRPDARSEIDVALVP